MSVKGKILVDLNVLSRDEGTPFPYQNNSGAYASIVENFRKLGMQLVDSRVSYSEEIDAAPDGGVYFNGLEVTKLMDTPASDVIATMRSRIGDISLSEDASILGGNDFVADPFVSLRLTRTCEILNEWVLRTEERKATQSKILMRDLVDRLLSGFLFSSVDDLAVNIEKKNFSRFAIPSHPLAGTVVVIGYARSGKTTLIHAFDRFLRHKLSEHGTNAVRFYSCGEPIFGSMPISDLEKAVSVSSQAMIKERLRTLESIAEKRSIVVERFNVIDSIREASIQSGNTLSGGISSYVPELLTRLSQDDNGFNRFSLVSFNPISFSDRQKETLDAVVQGLLGAASGVITNINVTSLNGKSVEEAAIEDIARVSFYFSHRGYKGRENVLLTIGSLVELCLESTTLRDLNSYGTPGVDARSEIVRNESISPELITGIISTIIKGD